MECSGVINKKKTMEKEGEKTIKIFKSRLSWRQREQQKIPFGLISFFFAESSKEEICFHYWSFIATWCFISTKKRFWLRQKVSRN